MYYPIWDLPVAGGALAIAGIAIVHVIIAHFAVGAGIFNVLTERRARVTADATLLGFVRENSRFLIYLSFVAGAITGVGIWFTIGLVSPEATTYLIRVFFWIWAIEWVFFVVELASGYVYYYTWDRLSPVLHEAVGWIYAGSAFMSLVMINGILTFMLTPGDWLQTGAVFDAWLNPSFWPSLFLRLVSALSLAGIFVALVAARTKRYAAAERTRIVKWGAYFLLSMAFMPLLAVWYFSTIPAASRDLALGGAIAMSFIFVFGAILSFLAGVYAYFGVLRKARDINFETAVLLAVIAFMATASMEFVREGIRKPYVIRDIIYSNGILLADVAKFNQEGILANSRWVQPDSALGGSESARGEAIYKLQCLRCHQIEGYNAMVPLIKTWNRPLVMSALDHLDLLKGFMPPFIGTESEQLALATYLMTLTDRQGCAVATDSLELELDSVDTEETP
ncbi:cytochrome ubiquinol oxidase subunit I [candidate division KSB1 bacterium]|nr:cytochrome ubiquinol oxidase subunit I [candidate division KSB1 bacterium]